MHIASVNELRKRMPVPDGLRALSLLVTKVPQENKSLVLWEEIPGQESNIPKIKAVLPLSWPYQESLL